METRNELGAGDAFDPVASQLFQALVVQTPPGQVAAAMRDLCAAHPHLAESLESLHSCWAVAAQLLESNRISDGREVALSLGIDSKDLEDRYTTRELVGRGGMGVVHSAFDERLRREVAIKRPGLTPAATQVRRFVREALVSARLDHPAIVPVHDLGTDAEGRPWLSMKLVRGEELTVAIDRSFGGTAAPSLAGLVVYLLRACEAVSYAHANGIVHRDLKPSNIMIGEFGEVFVMDWGLAAILEPDDSVRGQGNEERSESVEATVSWAHDFAATKTGEILGTLHYMAPEQAREDAPGPSPTLDIFSAGSILHQILTGAPPHHGVTDPRELLDRVRSGVVAVPRSSPRCPPELIAISRRAMAAAAAERYPTMAAMIDDLRAWSEGRVVAAHDTSVRARLAKWLARHPARAGLFVALVLGLPLIAWLTIGNIRSARAARMKERTEAFESYLAEGFEWSSMDRGMALQAFDRALVLRPRSGLAAIGRARAMRKRDAARGFVERWLGAGQPTVGIELWLAGTPRLRPEVRERVLSRVMDDENANDVDAYVAGLALLGASDRNAVRDARRMFAHAALRAPRPRLLYHTSLLFADRLLGDERAMRAGIVALAARFPGLAIADLSRALALTELREFAASRNILDRLLGMRPRWVAALKARAQVAWYLGRRAVGLDVIERALAVRSSVDLLLLKAKILALPRDGHPGEFARAVEIIKGATDFGEHGPRAYFLLGRLHYKLGHTRAALAAFDRALASWPDPEADVVLNNGGDMQARLRTNRGAALRQLGRLKEARSTLEGLMRNDERPWQTGYQLALLELGSGNEKAARERLQDAADRGSGEPEVTNLIGWLEDGRVPSDTEDFVITLCEIGLVAYRTRNFDIGERFLTAATEIEPRSHSGWQLLGALRMDRGRREAALRPLRRALEIEPKSPESGTNLGICLTDLGKFDAARAVLRDVVAHHPRFARGHLWLGVADCRQARYETGLPLKRKAFALAPGDASVRENLMRGLVTVGRFKEALEVGKGAKVPGAYVRRLIGAIETLFRSFAGEPNSLQAAIRKREKKREWHAANQLYDCLLASSAARRVEFAVPAARAAIHASAQALAVDRERLLLAAVAHLRVRILAMKKRVESQPERVARWLLELGTYLNRQQFPMGSLPLPKVDQARKAWRELESLVRDEITALSKMP